MSEVRMMNQRRFWVLVGATIFSSLSVAQASATTFLSGTVFGDNALSFYVSTSPSVLGTLVTSLSNSPPVSFYFVPLSPGANYLNITVTNYTGPSGWEGTFQYGNQRLNSDTTHWSAALASSSWFQPTGSVQSYGTNSTYTANGGPWGSIDLNAEFIDGTGNAQLYNSPWGTTVEFQAEIFVGTPSAPGPVLGAGLLSLTFLVLAGVWTKARGFLAR